MVATTQVMRLRHGLNVEESEDLIDMVDGLDKHKYLFSVVNELDAKMNESDYNRAATLLRSIAARLIRYYYVDVFPSFHGKRVDDDSETGSKFKSPGKLLRDLKDLSQMNPRTLEWLDCCIDQGNNSAHPELDNSVRESSIKRLYEGLDKNLKNFIEKFPSDKEYTDTLRGSVEIIFKPDYFNKKECRTYPALMIITKFANDNFKPPRDKPPLKPWLEVEWFVEKESVSTALHLEFTDKIIGKEVRCRVKSKENDGTITSAPFTPQSVSRGSREQPVAPPNMPTEKPAQTPAAQPATKQEEMTAPQFAQASAEKSDTSQMEPTAQKTKESPSLETITDCLKSLQYIVADRNDYYAVNSLEYLDFYAFMYVLLQEQGFQKVIIIGHEGRAGEGFPVLDRVNFRQTVSMAIKSVEEYLKDLPASTVKTGIVLPLESLQGEIGWVNILPTLLKSGNSSVYVTADDTSAFRPIFAKLEKYCKEFRGEEFLQEISASGLLQVAGKKPGVDEIQNLLARNKLLKSTDFEWLPYTKLPALAQYISKKWGSWHDSKLSTLEKILNELEKREQLMEIAKTLGNGSITPKPDTKTFSIERVSQLAKTCGNVSPKKPDPGLSR